MSLESVYTKSKAQEAISIMRNALTADKLRGKMPKEKSSKHPHGHHPYQRPTNTDLNKSTASTSSSRSGRISKRNENWADKQEHGFVNWLNFIFSPYYDDEDPMKTTLLLEEASDKGTTMTYRELAYQRRQTLLRNDVVLLMKRGEDVKALFERLDKVCICNYYVITRCCDVSHSFVVGGWCALRLLCVWG